jgi:hypothetical protein
MAESETRKISIKGGAVDDYNHSKGLKKRSTRKQKGGYDQPPGTEIQPNMGAARRFTNVIKSGGGEEAKPIIASTLPGSNPNPQPLENIKQMPALNEANKQGTIPPTVNPPPPVNPTSVTENQKGGKLVLAPKKKVKGKVVLAPPSHESKKGKRGQTRKIRIQLSNMKKRFSTAKVIHKDSKEKSIGDIRKLLEEAKLVKPIKEGKKVPDEILRSIYKDYLLLRNKAL